MAQQAAFRQQGKLFTDSAALAVEGVFQKARRIAKGGALLVEEQRGDIVDDRADGKTTGDRQPGVAHIGALPDELVRSLEAELDRKGGDQRAGGKGQYARQHLLGKRNVKSEYRAQHDRTGCGQ